MSRRPWFPFYIGDYLADTGHLSLEQHGAYLLLMLHYYHTRTLPVDAVHRICRCSDNEDKEICDSVLQEFFLRDGEIYKHKRIEQEIVILDRKSEACAARATIAANARWKSTFDSVTPPATPRKSKEESPIDPRHNPVRECILALHAETFPAAPTCPWDGKTGTVLKKVLKANPGWTVSQIQNMVENRFKSEGIAPDAPAKWLSELSSYAVGPLNKFKRLEAVSQTNGQAPVGNAVESFRKLLQ